jgi:hypothetical protein
MATILDYNSMEIKIEDYAQVTYYTAHINGHLDYDLAGIYADEDISCPHIRSGEIEIVFQNKLLKSHHTL